jgi:hypothetical protein
MKRADNSVPEALAFEHVRAARKGPYLSAELYAVEGISGVFRRVPGGTDRDGVVRARYGAGHLHLVRDGLTETELIQAGFLRLRDGGQQPPAAPPPAAAEVTPAGEEAPGEVRFSDVKSRHEDLPGQMTFDDQAEPPAGTTASAAEILAREGVVDGEGRGDARRG